MGHVEHAISKEDDADYVNARDERLGEQERKKLPLPIDSWKGLYRAAVCKRCGIDRYLLGAKTMALLHTLLMAIRLL